MRWDTAFIFQMCNFSVSTNIFDLITFTGIFDLHVKNFNIDHKFWTVTGRAFIFDILYIPSDKTFLSVPFFLPWPWHLTYIFTCVFLVTIPFRQYQHFLPCEVATLPLTYMFRTNTNLNAGDHICLSLLGIIYYCTPV